MWVLIQARTNSTRFPNKAMALLDGEPLVKHIYDRARMVWSNVCFVIPFNDPLKDYFYKSGMMFIEGPENDVLARYKHAADMLHANWVCRLTADCPLLDVAQLAYMIWQVTQAKLDFLTNLPCVDGHDIEIISKRALDWSYGLADKEYDREHVMTYFKSHIGGFKDKFSHGTIRSPWLNEWMPKLSVDTPEDLLRIQEIYSKLKTQP